MGCHLFISFHSLNPKTSRNSWPVTRFCSATQLSPSSNLCKVLICVNILFKASERGFRFLEGIKAYSANTATLGRGVGLSSLSISHPPQLSSDILWALWGWKGLAWSQRGHKALLSSACHLHLWLLSIFKTMMLSSLMKLNEASWRLIMLDVLLNAAAIWSLLKICFRMVRGFVSA